MDRCQCLTFGDLFSCTLPVTQEDLRCDTCRAGCNGAMSIGDPRRHEHVHLQLDGRNPLWANVRLPVDGARQSRDGGS